ncbi:SEC10/PgrA surface exclusion domain-containing protein [Streptococcus equi]|uniref:SEC10/PgrA surface exclusion domain-containing protein n=1 Tax=Streptococcus equi TaxID=1336 RepID=UPI001E5547DB|nr:SEC10/PgrA surface exclusion domain-containing protein [Streptococcus equi]MCD3445413.1 SEC10/PgrA surface exclusion domain-containing protein [Streptococcus equi subsp. zooepidemicus]
MKKFKGFVSIALSTIMIGCFSPALVNANQTSISLQQAEAKVKSLEQTVLLAEGNVSKANSNLAAAKPAYDNAKAKVEQARNTLNSYPIFKLSQEYVNALKDYRKKLDIAGEQKLIALADEGLKNNVYVANPKDNYSVDVLHLTNNQLIELAWYAQSIESQIRTQFGTPQVYVTQGSIDFSKAIANRYTADDWYLKAHHEEAIKQLAKSFGLKEGQYYENLLSAYAGGVTKTMADLKHDIHLAYTEMMFAKDEWFHAMGLAGIWYVNDIEYLSIGFSRTREIDNVHIIAVGRDEILPGSSFDSSVIVNPNNYSNYQLAVSQAQEQLSLSESIYNQRSLEKQAADNALTKARADLAQAKRVLDDLRKDSQILKQTTKSTTKTISKQNPIIKGLQPVYRLYHSGLRVHLYTKDKNEYQVLSARGWKQEGQAWMTSSKGDPVYRLYHSGLKVHLYTRDKNEYQVLATRGWRQEGIAYRSEGNVKVYRLYHSGIKKHLYTKDKNEYQVLSTRGWKQEGIAWYAK